MWEQLEQKEPTLVVVFAALFCIQVERRVFIPFPFLPSAVQCVTYIYEILPASGEARVLEILRFFLCRFLDSDSLRLALTFDTCALTQRGWRLVVDISISPSGRLGASGGSRVSTTPRPRLCQGNRLEGKG